MYENKDNLINFIDQAYPSPPNSSPNKPSTDPAFTLIADAGTTGNFAAASSTICTKVKPVTKGVSVLLPNTSYIQSTHIGELSLPHLPLAAQKVHLFPKMGRALLVIPVLCDHGCQAIFEASGLVIKSKSTGLTILTGTWYMATGLWIVDLSTQSMSHNPSLVAADPETLIANSEIASETMPERIQFLHAALGYPVLTTFIDAIENGHYTSIPELTAAHARKYFKQSAATIKGI